MVTKLKAVLAGALVLMLLLPQTVMAAESNPVEILMAATANSLEKSYIISGWMEAFASVNDEEEMYFFADIELAFGLDLEEETLKFLLKMPITMEDPLTGEYEFEVVGIFYDGENFFNFRNDAWVLDRFAPSMDIGSLPALMQWSMDISEYLYTILPVAFAEEQMEGYYVIDIILGNYEVLNLIDELLTLENIVALGEMMGEEILEEDLVWLEEELAFAMDYVVSFMDYIDLFILFRNYINTETMLLSAFDLDMGLGIELSFFGTSFNMDMLFNSSFVIDYWSEIVWPATY